MHKYPSHPQSKLPELGWVLRPSLSWLKSVAQNFTFL